MVLCNSTCCTVYIYIYIRLLFFFVCVCVGRTFVSANAINLSHTLEEKAKLFATQLGFVGLRSQGQSSPEQSASILSLCSNKREKCSTTTSTQNNSQLYFNTQSIQLIKRLTNPHKVNHIFLFLPTVLVTWIFKCICIYHKPQKFGVTKVWQIREVISSMPNFICQFIIQCWLHGKFSNLSFAKLLNMLIHFVSNFVIYGIKLNNKFDTLHHD